MDVKELIETQADSFLRDYDGIMSYSAENDGRKFKNDLESKLYEFDEKYDKLIFLYRIKLGLEDRLKKHKGTCTHQGTNKCQVEQLYEYKMFFTEQSTKKLNPEFEYTLLRPNLNASIIKSNLLQMAHFPDVAKQFQSAIDKLNEGKYERNLVDDLRLALELLLKQILSNDKPLEKQTEHLGKYLEKASTSLEVRNMLLVLIDYYSKYQNSKVKHDDSVRSQEVELIVNLTSAMMHFILNA